MTASSLLDQARLRSPRASDAACVDLVAAELIADLGLTSPPVNVEMLASLLDVRRVVQDHVLDTAGCLICGATGAEIRVRSTDPLPRQRFTIGHECAHIFFPGYALQPRFRCTPRPGQPSSNLEGLCDRGASRLLMPDTLFAPESQAVDFGLASIGDLSDLFEVSLAATAIRFVQLRAEPCAFLSLEVRQKPVEYRSSAPPQLRLQWSATSGRWPHLPRHKSVEDGDVFDRAHQGEIVYEPRTTIRSLTRSEMQVEAHCQLAPYFDGSQTVERVVALLRQIGH